MFSNLDMVSVSTNIKRGKKKKKKKNNPALLTWSERDFLYLKV